MQLLNNLNYWSKKTIFLNEKEIINLTLYGY